MSETKATTGTASPPTTESKTGAESKPSAETKKPAAAAAREMRKGAPGKGDTGPAMWPDFMALAEANMAAMNRANAALFKGVADLNKEVMSYADTSVRDYFACTESMARCDSWTEAMGKQTEFARSATMQYLDEAAKLLNMGTALAREGWAPWQESAERAFTRRAK